MLHMLFSLICLCLITSKRHRSTVCGCICTLSPINCFISPLDADIVVLLVLWKVSLLQFIFLIMWLDAQSKITQKNASGWIFSTIPSTWLEEYYGSFLNYTHYTEHVHWFTYCFLVAGRKPTISIACCSLSKSWRRSSSSSILKFCYKERQTVSQYGSMSVCQSGWEKDSTSTRWTYKQVT